MNRPEDRLEGKLKPLCVDLDQTFFLTDTLHETVVSILLRKPWLLFYLLFQLWRGRAAFKLAVSQLYQLPIATLPVNQQLLEFLKAESKVRPVWLVTAATQAIADQVVANWPVFVGAIGSSTEVNLKGRQKAELLVTKFGQGGFDYIGDSRADLKVWPLADQVGVVVQEGGRANSVKLALAKIKPMTWEFTRPSRSRRSWLKAIRVHQWVKNLLLFAPIVMAHQIFEPVARQAGIISFLAFSFTASAVYLLNDLIDLEADRAHPIKRLRPAAQGVIGVLPALLVAVGLLVSGATLSLLLPNSFATCLALYFSITCLYSAWGKTVPIVDIITLAGLYTLRIFAGAMAAQVPVSNWALAFSMFLFLSLACVKRVAELTAARDEGRGKLRRRGYGIDDLDQIARFGSTSGYLSVLVLALYLQSQDVEKLYIAPDRLWLLCPVLLYWISRVWLLTSRGELNEDPIVFALHDRVSYLCGALCGVIMYIAH